MFGNNPVAGTVGTRQLSPGYSDTPAGTLIIEFQAPFDAVIDGLRIQQNNSFGNGFLSVYTLFVNNVASPVTVPVPGNVTSANNPLPSVNVVAGDLLRFEQAVATDLGGSVGGVVATMRIRPL